MEKHNYLDILKGEKLSSVVFVMDYLQLDFDGKGFTMNIWPLVNVENTSQWHKRIAKLIFLIVDKPIRYSVDTV